MSKGTDITMEWCQYWGWLASDIPATKEKIETIRYFLDANVLGGMSDAGVLDCLEFAPKSFVEYLHKQNKIPARVFHTLIKVQPKSNDPPQRTWNEIIDGTNKARAILERQ